MAKIGIIYDKDIKERVFGIFSELVSSPSSITFEGNDIVKNGVSTTIIATLRDGLTLFMGEKLTYEVKHGNTVLGSGTKTTNNNGEVTINYTGTAFGKIDVIVKYRTLLQETYIIRDCSFIDWGTDTQYTNWSYQNNITQSRDTSETTLELTNSGTTGVKRLDGFNGDYCFEFDIKLVDGNSYIQLREGSTNRGTISGTMMGISDNQYHHIKIEVKDSTVTVTSDTTEKSPITLTGAWNRFYLNLDGNYTSVVKYKNFCYYPI